MKTNKKQNRLTMKSIFALILLTGLGFSSTAQEDTVQTKPFQITFVTPLGTNGTNAPDITNGFSINLFAGYNGGLDGVELSGFGAILKNNMKGTQISGFGNIVMGTGKGFQGAGQFNYAQKQFTGVQASGFANIIMDNAKAWQISGFANVTAGKIDGAQLSGFANYAEGTTVGQASSFANVNKGNLSGVQFAGFANVNTEKTEGIQVAGFSNYTKILSGVQIAPFNYIDSLEKGVPIGIFSIVKNGYRAIEISGNETLYGNVSFKTGTKRFYNIVSVGAAYQNDIIVWGFGYGIGTLMDLKKNWDLAFELMSYQLNEDEWFTKAINTHNKIQFTTSKKVSENLRVFGGISWNANISETIDNDGNTFISKITPWDVFDETYTSDDVNIKMYPGFTVGIRF